MSIADPPPRNDIRPPTCTSVHPSETTRLLPPAELIPPLGCREDQLQRLLDGLLPGPVAFRHSGWASQRFRICKAMVRMGYSQGRIQRFASCGDRAYVLRRIDDPECVRVAGSACRDRWCVPCARDRARTIAANLIQYTAGLKLRFLTLTLKHSPALLSEQLARLHAHFERLRRQEHWKKHVKGGAAMIEVTYDKLHGLWHPHLHILFEGTYLPHQKLRTMWHKITADSYIVDVRAVNDASAVHRYVSKYVSKPMSGDVVRSDRVLDDFLQAMQGKRLCATFGTWAGFKLCDIAVTDRWENLGSLDEWLRKKRAGDIEAIELLSHLDSTAVQHAIDKLPAAAEKPRGPPEQWEWHRQFDMFDLFRESASHRIWKIGCPRM